MDVILLLAVHLGWMGTGLVLRQFFSGREVGAIRQILESYILGMALQTALIYSWVALAPVPWAWPRLLTGLGVAGLAWAIASGLGRKETSPSPSRQGGEGWRARVSVTALTALLIPPLALGTLASVAVPIHHWDSLAIWIAKAGWLFHGDYLHGVAFTDPAIIHPHPGYPIGYSIGLYQQAAVIGTMDHLLLNVGLWLWIVAATGLLGLLLAEWVGGRTAAGAIVLLAWTPALWRPEVGGAMASGYADFPLGLTVALATGLLLSWFRSRDIAMLATGMGALTLTLTFKNEGLLWVLLFFVLGAGALLLERPALSRPERILLAWPLLACVLLRVAHAHLPSSSDLLMPSVEQIAALPQTLPALVSVAVQEVVLAPRWGALRWFLPAATLVGLVRARRLPAAALGLAAPLFLLASLLILGLLEIQHGNHEYFVEVTFPRLAIQTIPVAILFGTLLNSERFLAERRLDGAQESSMDNQSA